MDQPKRKKHLHKVEKITGMSHAFMLVTEYSILGSSGESEEDSEEKRREIGRKGVRKIAELWELSVSAEKILNRKWVETKLKEVQHIEVEGLMRIKGIYVPEDESDNLGIEILLGEEEGNVGDFKKLQTKLKESLAILSESRRVKNGHIYLDVTEIDYKTFCRAYKAIKLCRSELGMNKRDMKKGAPESIDETRALLAARAEKRGLSRKEIAESLDFKIYDEDNPSGSFPLLHKYIKMGRELADKLDGLEEYLQEITGIKV